MKRIKVGNGKNGRKAEPLPPEDEDDGSYDMLLGGRTLSLPKMGPYTSYKPEYVRIAKAMCDMGATDAELASEFGVTLPTIHNWRCKYKPFADACTVGKEAFDERAERTLAQLAVGFHYRAEEVKVVDKQVVRVEVLKYHPPEFLAIMAWLRNRKPEAWRDKSEINVNYEIKDPQAELERRMDAIAARRQSPGSSSKPN